MLATRKQGMLTQCSISVNVVLECGLADAARHAQYLFSTLAVWVICNMTAALHVTDTNVACRVNAVMNRRRGGLEA